jgi:hypothetical protein
MGGAVGGEQQVARHPQVHDEEDLVLELPHEVLAAPRNALDRAAGDGGLDVCRVRGLAPSGVEYLHVRDHAPLDRGGQEALDRLDFGQLGHAPEHRRSP